MSWRTLRAWAQIDYQGPKERIQLVALNTIEGKQSEPIVFYDEKYGAADLEISGDTSTYFRGEAFRRPRQTVVVDVFSVKDCAGTPYLGGPWPTSAFTAETRTE